MTARVFHVEQDAPLPEGPGVLVRFAALPQGIPGDRVSVTFETEQRWGTVARLIQRPDGQEFAVTYDV
jgi:hypothetical protein